MAGLCEGRVVVVTGAGGGIGRAHALLFAEEGAKVVVNDLGGSRDGERRRTSAPAQAVVDEIKAAGGEAVANTEDIATWDGAEGLVQTAVDTFGTARHRRQQRRHPARPDVRQHDRGRVGRGHRRCTSRARSGRLTSPPHYWRDQSKAGEAVDARIINTTSPSGIFGNVGQANYGAAKAGIAAFTVIAAQELGATASRSTRSRRPRSPA